MKFFDISARALFLIFLSLVENLSSPLPEHVEVIKISAQNNSLYVRDIMRLSKAAEMRNYMNESVDPCQNFYAFSCGNWAKINPANSIEKLSTGLLQALTSGLDRKVALMLKSGSDPDETEIDKKVKDFYASCTKVKHLNGEYKAKLLDIIAEFGVMPALSGDKWDENGFDWLETIAKISHKYGVDIMFTIDVLPDYANNTMNRIYVGHPEFPLESRSMYLDSVNAVYRDIYRSRIESDLKRFLSIPDQMAKETSQEIVNFEVALATGMLDEKLGLGLDEISELTTIEEMQNKYAPTIDIKKFVNIILGQSVEEHIYEFVEEYQKNLKSIIENTSRRIVANYIFYTLLRDFYIRPKDTEVKHEQLCIEKTKKYFSKNLDNMIYRKYNTRETERDVNLIWDELKSTFKLALLSNKHDWIQLVTRQYAIEKLEATKLDINSYVNENFTEEFGDLQIYKSDYIQNIKNILELDSSELIDKLSEPPQPLEAAEILSYTPANILLENTIKVPISLLQPYYLWAANYPNALKFGTLGSLIGHELIHGFDDSGRKFDKNGNNFDWWDDASADDFVKRTECFTEQYSKYLYGGRFLPRSISQSENIADNGGVRLAYAAYLKWYEDAAWSGKNLQLESLPTLNYTSKQLFFISYAQVWCNDVHPRLRDLETSTDQHVPGKYRVIGPLSNFGAFAKEFHCAAGSRMNPIKKCRIY